ncbi:hypothetical protein J1N35_041795 [Gossypium stocksii]|uniref:Uncharacterized protein n=1 Tax=Gossypium stocksii TaxID=47602 RepID=A0A9D3UG51_9ROSI|nr:hypothetical protein J1N35_041795 [Gossypium stocksii]
MDSKSKQSPLTLGVDNPELGTEALTKLIREVLEEVFEARFKADDETLQARHLECNKKRDHSLLKQEARSVKRVKTCPNFSTCEHCKRCHLGEYGSLEHRVRDCTIPF